LEFTNRVISAGSERISPQNGGRTNVYEVVNGVNYRHFGIGSLTLH